MNSPHTANDSDDSVVSRLSDARSTGDRAEQAPSYVEEFQRREQQRYRKTKRWRYFGELPLILLAATTLFMVVCDPLGVGATRVPALRVLPTLMLVAALTAAVFLMATRKGFAGFIAATGELRCPKCNHGLSGSVKARCPYCAVRLRPDGGHPSVPEDRWERFTWWILVAFVTIGSVVFSLSVRLTRANKNKEAAAEIHRIKEKVGIDGGYLTVFTSRTDWIGNLLGDPGRPLHSHFRVSNKSDFDDAGLVHLERLTTLNSVDLNGARITGPGLVHLQRCAALHVLDLRNTQMTDEGLVHLKDLKHLRSLSLAGTQISDAGLTHLTGMAGLRRLDLQLTRATDEGVKKLRQALPNCTIRH